MEQFYKLILNKGGSNFKKKFTIQNTNLNHYEADNTVIHYKNKLSPLKSILKHFKWIICNI
jgi:hypothetical protein